MNTTLNSPVVSLMPDTSTFQHCIDACYKCAQICTECARLCMEQEDVKSRIDHINMLFDCADICTTTACFMSRRSKNTSEILNMCSNMCINCAKECEKFNNDQHCISCAEVYRMCADECRNVILV